MGYFDVMPSIFLIVNDIFLSSIFSVSMLLDDNMRAGTDLLRRLTKTIDPRLNGSLEKYVKIWVCSRGILTAGIASMINILVNDDLLITSILTGIICESKELIHKMKVEILGVKIDNLSLE